MSNRTKTLTPRASRRRRASDVIVLDGLDRVQPLAPAQRKPLTRSRFILGGHSFIAPLGRDAEPSPVEKGAIVAACLEHGIDVFDTTYAPERSQFAQAVTCCNAGSSVNACPILWNFFGGLTDPLPGPQPWTEARWTEALAELQPWTGRPNVVLHTVDDLTIDRQQIATVVRWKHEGRIGALGLWPGSLANWADDQVDALDFVVAPWNVASAGKSRPLFIAARERGLITVGTSPFTRGWEVDRLAKRLAIFEQRPVAEARSRVADALLRFAAFAPEVDHLIVAMRSSAYVTDNFASLERGPLSPHEQRWIDGLSRTMAVKTYQ